MWVVKIKDVTDRFEAHYALPICAGMSVLSKAGVENVIKLGNFFVALIPTFLCKQKKNTRREMSTWNEPSLEMVGSTGKYLKIRIETSEIIYRFCGIGTRLKTLRLINS